MSDGKWVRKIIAGIVIGNLIVLVIFFLLPRGQFILAHKNLTRNQLMETAGSSDMPNQLARTYQLVNRIKEMTSLKARVFMPPGDRLEGSFRSAVIQILYPREIFFGEDENFASRLEDDFKDETSYFVYSPDWRPEFCAESSRIELTDFGFGMCRRVP
jgi:hypothetical protein